MARALEVGREDWGFSELGRKAGVPPVGVGDEGGEDRQTHQSSPTAVPSGCIFDARSTSSNTAPKRPLSKVHLQADL